VNLIITSEVVKPPIDVLSVRFLTMVCQEDLNLSVLVEVLNEDKDFYYRYMKDTGLMDFVEDLIPPEYREEGIRIDSFHNYPKTIIVKRIDLENVVGVLGQVKFLASV